MKRHGLALFICHYRKYQGSFFNREERFNGACIGYYFEQAAPRPYEIVQKVCYRYLRIKNKLTVGNWNCIVETVANRVSNSVGARVVIRKLAIVARDKKQVSLDKFGNVVCTGKSFSYSKLHERLERFKSLIEFRKQNEAHSKWLNLYEAKYE